MPLDLWRPAGQRPGSSSSAAYFMLRDGVKYQDLGHDHFDQRDKTKTIRRLLKRLADLGCSIEHPALAT